MRKGNLLIVDDQVQILESLKILFKSEFHSITTTKDPGSIPELFARNSFDIILLDMNFSPGETSGDEGIFWLKKILKLDALAVVILITAFGDIELAVKAMKKGALDFITKPWDPDKLRATLKSAYELRLSRLKVKELKNKQFQVQQDLDKNFKFFLGSSKTINLVMETVQKVAGTDANVLILGESGTGKEVIAREIHRLSSRANDVFISVDMASLSESLFESEMFGHIKGAFTDAREDRPGRFEVASGGTLFLDEIANLSLTLQAKILHVLQLREVTRVGSSKAIPIDIRLISATNKPVQKMIEEQTFREDLYFRLNTIKTELPPLRDRVEDIPGLAEFFLSDYTKKYEKPFLKLNSKSIDKLCAYPWPGNIRELRHTIEKAVILSDHPVLRPEDLYLNARSAKPGEKMFSHKLSDMEKHTICQVLKTSGGNLSRAARMLEISRTTLYVKMKKYGL